MGPTCGVPAHVCQGEIMRNDIETVRRKLLQLKSLREKENELITDIIHLCKEYDLYVDLNSYHVADKKWLL